MKFRPRTAGFWMIRKHSQSGINAIQQAVGCGVIISGDIPPDIDQIDFCSWSMTNIKRHVQVLSATSVLPI